MTFQKKLHQKTLIIQDLMVYLVLLGVKQLFLKHNVSINRHVAVRQSQCSHSLASCPSDTRLESFSNRWTLQRVQNFAPKCAFFPRTSNYTLSKIGCLLPIWEVRDMLKNRCVSPTAQRAFLLLQAPVGAAGPRNHPPRFYGRQFFSATIRF